MAGLLGLLLGSGPYRRSPWVGTGGRGVEMLDEPGYVVVFSAAGETSGAGGPLGGMHVVAVLLAHVDIVGGLVVEGGAALVAHDGLFGRCVLDCWYRRHVSAILVWA